MIRSRSAIHVAYINLIRRDSRDSVSHITPGQYWFNKMASVGKNVLAKDEEVQSGSESIPTAEQHPGKRKSTSRWVGRFDRLYSQMVPLYIL